MSVCTRKSDGRIFVQYKKDGKVKRKYFNTRIEAERYNRDHVHETKVAVTSKYEFHELVQLYLEAKQSHTSEVNFDNTLYKFQGSIIPALIEVGGSHITHAALDRYVNLRARSVKLTTVHRELSDIRAVLNWSVRRKLLARSPMVGWDMPKRDDEEIQPISQEELEKLIKHSSIHLQKAMLLAYFLGLRPGAVELLSIRYSQVNWSASTLRVVSAKKGGIKSREIPIHPNLQVPLRAWYKEDGSRNEAHIITWNGKPVKSIKKAFAAAKRRAGISGRKLPLYALRHTFVTTLMHSGVDLRTIASMTGNDPETLLKHYSYAASAATTKAVTLLPDMEMNLNPQLNQGKKNEK